MEALRRSLIKTAARFVVLAGLAGLTLSGCTGPRQAFQGPALQAPHGTLKKEANGIEVMRVGLAVNGMMLDLRYRITDFGQARQILKQNTPLSIVDEATGRVLTIADSGKVGKLRNIPQYDDSSKVYWMFFNNVEGAVKAGSNITLVIGDVPIKGITVE